MTKNSKEDPVSQRIADIEERLERGDDVGLPDQLFLLHQCETLLSAKLRGGDFSVFRTLESVREQIELVYREFEDLGITTNQMTGQATLDMARGILHGKD